MNIEQKLDDLSDEITAYGDKVEYTIKHAFNRGFLLGLVAGAGLLILAFMIADQIVI